MEREGRRGGGRDEGRYCADNMYVVVGVPGCLSASSADVLCSFVVGIQPLDPGWLLCGWTEGYHWA